MTDLAQQLKSCPGCGAKEASSTYAHSHVRVVYECGTPHVIPSHGGRGNWKRSRECDDNQQEASDG